MRLIYLGVGFALGCAFAGVLTASRVGRLYSSLAHAKRDVGICMEHRARDTVAIQHSVDGLSEALEEALFPAGGQAYFNHRTGKWSIVKEEQ